MKEICKLIYLIPSLLCFLIVGCSDDSADGGVDISLNKENLVLEKGKGERLIASFNPVDAKNQGHVWSSGNPQVATVDETGYVTAVAVGEAVIAAKALDGDDIATCNVTVVDKIIPVTSVSLSKSECEITVGESVALSAIVNPSNATNKNVTWESSNNSVVTVNEEGVITACAIGEATITVKTDDAGKTAVCNVSVVAKGIKFTQPTLENVTSNSVYISGIITPLGVETAEMGVCYATTQNPTTDDYKVAFNNGNISHIIKGLTPETTYYIRFYAIADGAVRYGDQTIFETLTAVEIPAPEFSNVTSNSAVISGVIKANGSVLKETGIVYSQSSSPTVDDNKILISNEDISYTLFGLDANTTYYVRLYAMVGEKVYYGAESELLTNEKIITNFEVSDYYYDRLILKSKAPRGYDKINICYGTNPNPTITDNITSANLNSDGLLELDLSSLKSNTTYYVRSYSITGTKVEYHDNEVAVRTMGGDITVGLGSIRRASEYTTAPLTSIGLYIEVYTTLPSGTYLVDSSTADFKNSLTGNYTSQIYITGSASFYMKTRGEYKSVDLSWPAGYRYYTKLSKSLHLTMTNMESGVCFHYEVPSSKELSAGTYGEF